MLYMPFRCLCNFMDERAEVKATWAREAGSVLRSENVRKNSMTVVTYPGIIDHGM